MSQSQPLSQPTITRKSERKSAKKSNRKKLSVTSVNRKWRKQTYAQILLKQLTRLRREKDLNVGVRLQLLTTVRQMASRPSITITDLFHALSDFHFIPKNSTSDGIYFSANLHPQMIDPNWQPPTNQSMFQRLKLRQAMTQGIDVFIKLIQKYAGKGEWREIETAIVQKVIPRLVEEHRTPHVMLSLAVKPFHNYLTELFLNQQAPPTHFLEPSDFEALKEAFHKSGFVRHNGFVMISECGKGKSLYEETLVRVSGSTAYNTQQFCQWIIPITFQVLYTLMCFNAVQLTHYDMHVKNIWLQSTEHQHAVNPNQPFVMIYFITSTQYVILPFYAQSGFVRIYDWDYGYQKSASEPGWEAHRKGMCDFLGVCNEHHTEVDAFRYFTDMLNIRECPYIIEKMVAYLFRVSEPIINEEEKMNADLIFRVKQCRRQNRNPPYSKDCRANYLCYLKKQPQTGLYKCDGAWRRNRLQHPNAFPNIKEIMKRFLKFCHQHSIYSFVRLHTLNFQNEQVEFDPLFLPGTSGWLHRVFCYNPTVRKQIAENLKIVEQTKRLRPVSFSQRFETNPFPNRTS